MFGVRPMRNASRATFAKKGLDTFNVFSLTPGPMSYITVGFDRHLVKRASELTGDKWLMGSSTAALRAMAVVNSIVSGRNVIDEVLHKYVTLKYRPWYGTYTMSLQLIKVIMAAVPPSDVLGVLECKRLRVVVPVTLMPIDHLHTRGQLASLLTMAFKYIGGTLPRVIYFYTGDKRPDFLDKNLECRRITSTNFYHVLRATTGVPVFTTPITYIPGVDERCWFVDGAIGCNLYAPEAEESKPVLLVSSMGDAKNKRTMFSEPFYDDNITVVHVKQKTETPSLFDFINPVYMTFPDRKAEYWRRVVRYAESNWPENIFEDLPSDG
jgi:hypothetical protein